MRRTLLSLSIAAAISLPVLVQANPLTDQGGNQTVLVIRLTHESWPLMAIH